MNSPNFPNSPTFKTLNTLKNFNVFSVLRLLRVKKIDCYLGKIVIGAIFLVVLILLGFEAFIEFTREFPDIGNGSYGLPQVLAYVPMILPTDVYQLFPMAGLLGCVIGLGLLASHSELIVMRAAGVSVAHITLTVLKAAVLLSIVVLFMGEIVAPFLQHKATVSKAEAISGGQAMLTRQGIWLKDRNNFVHVQSVSSYEHLHGITRYSFDEENQLQLLSFAASADYEDGQWVFRDIVQTDLSAANDNNKTNNKVTTTHFAEQRWGLQLKPRLLDLTSMSAEQKSLPELSRYIKSLKQSGLNAASYEFGFWQRVFQPLTILVMIVLAIPFVFGPLRTATMGLRMLIGTMVGFVFYIFNQFIGPFSIVYQIPPLIAALSPTVIFAICGWILLRKFYE